LKSISVSSLKQYSSALKQWWEHNQGNEELIYNPKITNVLSYLTYKFENGSSYSSLNSTRSALSLIIPSINNQRLGEDVRIKRLMKAASKLKPPRPRYESVWDPSIVIKYITKWMPLDLLPLENLTYKLVILLALATAHRVQTFSMIKLDAIANKPNGLEIRVADAIKTSGIGKPQPCLFIPEFKTNPELCVASTLLRYIEVTKPLRGTENNLLISFKSPYKAVTSQTISRWIKKVLLLSGVDTNQFTSHSTRHASTSKAHLKGIDLNLIRKTAGWTSDSDVFAKFYSCPIDTSCKFASAVLINTE